MPEVQKLKLLKCPSSISTNITHIMMTFTSPDTGKVYEIQTSTSQRGFQDHLTTTYTIYDDGNFAQVAYSEDQILESVRCYENPNRWVNVGSRFD